MTTRITDAAQSAAADAVVDLVDAGAGAEGTLEIRTGPQPADADDADAGTLLVSIPLANPAFGAAAAGVAGGAGLPVSADAVADGIAEHARVKDTDGNVVFDGAVRAAGDPDGGEEVVLDNTNIATGQTVQIDTLNYTQPASE